MAEWLCSGLQLRLHRFDSVLSLQAMKILITGATGFIGSHLVKSLIKKEHTIVGIDNHICNYSNALKKARIRNIGSKNFKLYFCDINNIKNSETGVDLAIHLAAQPGVRVPKENEYLYEHSNILGFQSLCDYCVKNKIKKIIYASSSSVYSDTDTAKFNESKTKLHPKSKYGQSKLANEIYASKMAYTTDISFVGLRFFSVYGSFGRPDMAYYLFTEALCNNKKIILNNNGVMRRDMTHISDIIQGIEGAMTYILNEKDAKNQLFNLGNSYPISTSDLLKILIDKTKKNTQIVHKLTKNESDFTCADINKARNLLGYSPKISINDGLDEFLNWYKDYEKK